MSTRIIDRKFFLQPAEELAPQLLGKVLCRKLVDDNNHMFTVRGRITVTEAYCYGESFKDLTKTEKKGGHLYVIQIMFAFVHFGIVANDEGIGEGVLICGIDPYTEFYAARALDINTSLDGEDLVTSETIWLEDDDVAIIQSEPRTRSGDKSEKKLRFSVKEIKFRASS